MAFEGDIYITKLEQGLYGAIRILKHDVKIGFLDSPAYLVQVCNYIDNSAPLINDPRLLQPLLQNRFHHKNIPCIAYFSGSLDRENLTYLENIGITSHERIFIQNMESNSKSDFDYQGVFSEHTGWQAFIEWRWRNERLQMLDEEIMNRQLTMERLQKREKAQESSMSEETFWKIFLLFDWRQKTDNEVIEPAVRHLAILSVYDLRKFSEILHEKLYLLDTKKHAENIGSKSYSDTKKVFSPENFLSRRCLVVAKGKIIFDEILKDPSKMPQSTGFTALLNLVPHAYYRKTGRGFDYITEYNFETFSNIDGWSI